MARKKKRKKQAGAIQLSDRARRELAKGNAKSALKDAKVCYREDPSHDHRRLLEEAYLGRVQQLQSMKLSAEASTVLGELIELEPTTPTVQEQIPRLQVIVGHASDTAAEVLRDDPALLHTLVDQAVLDADSNVPDYGQTRAQVGQVRDALAAVEAGDDQRASELLGGISRTSPLCDWKVFVRGLSAFYLAQHDRAHRNWGRLDATRPAHLIAQTLLAAAGDVPNEEARADLTRSSRILQKHLQRDASVSLVQRLAEHIRGGDWPEFFRDYRQLCGRFAKSHKELVDGATDIVWRRAVREGDPSMLDNVIHYGPAPPLDPSWNRAQALMAEHPQESDAGFVEKFWCQYAEDVRSLACLAEDQRQIAAGLVFQHLGKLFVGYGDECDKAGLFSWRDPEQAYELPLGASEFFRRSLAACPQLTCTSKQLASLYETLEEPDSAAEVLRELLKHDSHDYDAHVWLANYYLACDEPTNSEPYVEAAFRLKPRDRASEVLRWNQRTTTIRCLTKKRKFDAAREAWQAAVDLADSPRVEPYALDALRVGIELKARNQDVAQKYLDSALEKVAEPTAIWMQMSCISARYSVPREKKKEFDDRFEKAINGNVTSQTAGCLTRLLFGLKNQQINYTGRATQERLTVAYLKRSDGVQWQEDDLKAVCDFLWDLPKQWELRRKLIAVGLEEFPTNPYFHFWTATVEMERGPLVCNIQQAESHVQQSLQLADASRDQQMIELAQQALGALRDYQEQSSFRLGPLDGDDDEEDDDYYDDDGFGADFLEFATQGVGDEDEDRGENQGPVDSQTAKHMLDELKHTLPAPLFEMLKSMASVSGVSMEEVTREIEAMAGGGSRSRGRRK